ncbi:linear amide C-N hydrolase [Hyphomicrobium sp.]|uniref:linear amide C-N hydrolase n=1 Tax=Hyphomicrobium sp. TaxID=82 RepID=UPI002FE2A994
MKPRLLTSLFCTTMLLAGNVAEACTRAVYLGLDGRYLTGRTFDWKDRITSNLWVFPRGIKRHGAAGPRSVEWTARHGSLVVSGYDISTVDGMNEAGLVANLLWQVNAQYPEDDGKTPRISLSIWAQYFLDQFATVAEAVEHVRSTPLQAATGEVPGQPGRMTTVHLSLSDATGDSAILEWIEGRLMIHHSRDYQVMTNEPRFEDQLAITRYWSRVPGTVFLPGTSRAEDRFARASFLINAIPKTDDAREAAAGVFSVIRNVSAPWGISIDDQPNLSTTRWRIVADHKERLYYFESVYAPNVFWVDLKQIDFSSGAEVRRLDLGEDQRNIFSGEVSGSFVAAKPFAFEPVD